MKNFKKNYKIFLLLFVLFSSFIYGMFFQKVKATENALSKLELNRYIESIDKITKIISDSVLILPELDMINSETIDNLLKKVNKYNNFLNDYTRDIEKEGGALFNDLLDGYRVNRKMFYLVKDVNSLARAFQDTYELLNTTEVFLEKNQKLIDYTEKFENSIFENRKSLNDNLRNAESLLAIMTMNVNMDRDSYNNDIDYLIFLRDELRDVTDNYLDLSTDIIKISQSILDLIADNSITLKVEECENGGGMWDKESLICICEDEFFWNEKIKKCIK